MIATALNQNVQATRSTRGPLPYPSPAGNIQRTNSSRAQPSNPQPGRCWLMDVGSDNLITKDYFLGMIIPNAADCAGLVDRAIAVLLLRQFA